MENQNYTEREYRAAQKAVNEKIGFYIHLSVYLLVNAFFHVLNYVEGGYYWAVWPALGWGIGLLFHGLGVFGFFSSPGWKQRQIQKELEKQRKLKERFINKA